MLPMTVLFAMYIVCCTFVICNTNVYVFVSRQNLFFDRTVPVVMLVANLKPRTMKVMLLVTLMLCSKVSYAQFAIVADKDGYVNLRSAANKNSKVTHKLLNGQLVHCFENDGNWISITSPIGDNELNGWIYNDRCRLVADYPAIPVVAKGAGMVKLAKDSIEVVLMQRSFEKSKHTYKYQQGASWIELVDNKRYWGEDGGLPKLEYKSIVVKWGTKTLELPQAAYADLYNPSLDRTKVNFDKDNNILYIYSSNSDGAGSYDIIWKIENGVYKQRFIGLGF